MTKHILFLTLLLMVTDSIAATKKPLRIVASIKPVHSLVAGIMQGVAEPELLMSSNQSPHHYSLRPSERKMLANADLIFWIGPSMESFMPRLIDSLENKSKAVELMQSHGLKLLPIRSFENKHHDHNEAHQETSNIDAHFWLDTNNADILVDAITRQIVRLDPEHKQQYQANNQSLHNQIALLRKSLQQLLDGNKVPFLTYHDGYQYFENEFGLNNAGSITTSELQPSARRLSEIKTLINKQHIECVFYDAPTEPPILKSLLANSNTRTFMLDPVGILMQQGKNTWFEIMVSLGKQFKNCQHRL